MQLSELSLRQLQQAIASGELAAREVAEQTLSAIEQHNPALNAWAEVTGQRRWREANRIDDRRRAGEQLPALAGGP